jgi:polysaccharide pyruvyl transferase WcaK-like protein
MSELPVYDGVTQPDFAGPHQFLSRTPDLDIRVASLGGQSITADRLTFSTLAAVESSDVLLVPGGGCIAEVPSMRDGWVFLILIRTQVAARSIGAPAMPSVPGNRTNQACLSHPWSEM